MDFTDRGLSFAHPPRDTASEQQKIVEYGRRRVIVRHRIDHPKAERTKASVERVVDLRGLGHRQLVCAARAPFRYNHEASVPGRRKRQEARSCYSLSRASKQLVIGTRPVGFGAISAAARIILFHPYGNTVAIRMVVAAVAEIYVSELVTVTGKSIAIFWINQPALPTPIRWIFIVAVFLK